MLTCLLRAMRAPVPPRAVPASRDMDTTIVARIRHILARPPVSPAGAPDTVFADISQAMRHVDPFCAPDTPTGRLLREIERIRSTSVCVPEHGVAQLRLLFSFLEEQGSLTAHGPGSAMRERPGLSHGHALRTG